MRWVLSISYLETVQVPNLRSGHGCGNLFHVFSRVLHPLYVGRGIQIGPRCRKVIAHEIVYAAIYKQTWAYNPFRSTTWYSCCPFVQLSLWLHKVSPLACCQHSLRTDQLSQSVFEEELLVHQLLYRDGCSLHVVNPSCFLHHPGTGSDSSKASKKIQVGS